MSTSEKDLYGRKKERKDLHEMAGERPICLKDYNSLMQSKHFLY